MPARLDRTRVGIVGGGPAGLSLSHLLATAGIDHVVLETRERAEIEATHRAGILEQGTVQMLRDMGLGDGVERHGHRHDGIDLRFGGESHRLDFPDLVGAAVWLYPQNEVFADLAAARVRDGGDVRWGVSDTVVEDHLGAPRVHFREADGTAVTLT
jgi:p-hydroxybenzoate 3-monooxygenase